MTEKDYERKKKMLDSIVDYRRLLESEWMHKDKSLAVIENKLNEEIDKYEESL